MKVNITYKKNQLKVIEFELENCIASSLDHGPNLSCGEEIFGMEGELT